MQNSLNLDSSEVISTYVYKTGAGYPIQLLGGGRLVRFHREFYPARHRQPDRQNRPKRVFGRKEELRHAFQIKGG